MDCSVAEEPARVEFGDVAIACVLAEDFCFGKDVGD